MSAWVIALLWVLASSFHCSEYYCVHLLTNSRSVYISPVFYRQIRTASHISALFRQQSTKCCSGCNSTSCRGNTKHFVRSGSYRTTFYVFSTSRNNPTTDSRPPFRHVIYFGSSFGRSARTNAGLRSCSWPEMAISWRAVECDVILGRCDVAADCPADTNWRDVHNEDLYACRPARFPVRCRHRRNHTAARSDLHYFYRQI